MSEPLVSVCMITYQHAPYIRQALDSVLMQKTKFPIKICLGEDQSSDGTREICLEFATKHPDVIHLFLRDRSDLARNAYKAPFMHNFIETLNACRGKYIAICEGDDYWTDPLKLQKQVDALESDATLSACAHRVAKVGSETGYLGSSSDRRYTFDDMCTSRLFHTASLLFRRQILIDQPLPIDTLSGDRALFMLCGSRGDIHYSGECMAAYRKHSGGISNTVSFKEMLRDLSIASWATEAFPNFPRHRYTGFIYMTVMRYSKSSKFWQYWYALGMHWHHAGLARLLRERRFQRTES